MLRLANRDARRLFLHKHGLAEAPSGPGRGDDLLGVIRRLGFVQVDSIQWVERAHHMILFSRRQRYRPRHLTPLLERDRALFEGWTHDASILPVEMHPWWRLRHARDEARLVSRWTGWQRDGFEQKFGPVLERIRDHGACCSADVGEGEARGSGGWWDWHPSKAALEFLWRSGRIAVTRREHFRKHYDLTERVIPEEHLGPQPPETEVIDGLCDAAMDRLGFATPGEIAAFWDVVGSSEAKDWADRAMAEGKLIPVEIGCQRRGLRRSLARPDVFRQAKEAPQPPSRMRVLSPFDPALRDRARAERLFGFRYRIEIFTPAPRRRYGYYVFPLLEGDRLVGRIDMKANRNAGTLDVTAVWPEAGVKWSDARQSRLESELVRVARFAGLDTVFWKDGWMRTTLE